MPVGELLRRLDSRELSEWMAYDQIEPLGEWRADLRAGIVAATLANVNRGKAQKPFKPEDFMPDFAGVAPSAGSGAGADPLSIFGMLAARGNQNNTAEEATKVIDQWWQSAQPSTSSGSAEQE